MMNTGRTQASICRGCVRAGNAVRHILHLLDTRGTGLAETAVLLPIYLIMLYAVIEFFHLQEHLFRAHTLARNAAWTSGPRGGRLSGLLTAVQNGRLELDDIMDTNCGRYRARHDTTTIIVPRLTVAVGYAVDKNTWQMDLSLQGIMNTFRRAFGADKLDDKFL